MLVNDPIASRAISVGLADKNPLILRGLKSLLGEDARFELAISATDGERFVDAVTRVAFDVGVIGWVMDHGDGRFVLEALRRIERVPRIVIYTGYAGSEAPREALNLGAAGFVSKTEAPERLLDVIAEVAAGHMVFPFIDVQAQADDPIAALTRRERQMLEGLVKGWSNGELAREFALSQNTVKFHLRNLYDKLGVRNRAQAVGLLLGRTEPS